MKSKLDYLLKHNPFLQRVYKTTMSYFFRFIGLFVKTDPNLILFNGHGQKYNDSPREIFLKLKDDLRYENFKYVWAVDDPLKYSIERCEVIKMDTLQYFMIALKAKYWVSCVNIERGLNFKKKSTIYLNTWHGTPLKLIGNAVPGRHDFNFASIDIFCCAGDYEREIYSKDFKVKNDSFLSSGLPRNDELYNISDNLKQEYKRQMGIPENKKVILYAPTWRDSSNKGKKYVIAPPVDIELWEKKLASDYILILRTHSYTNTLLGIEFNDFVKDYSAYPNVNDLFIVADVLISDYSAAIFDYSILERPILCFGYDYEQYAVDRGFYFDLDRELPGGVLKTQEEVINKILAMDFAEESKKIKQFKQKYLQYGGKATEECIEALLGTNK